MTREVVDTCTRPGTTPHSVMLDLIRHPYTTELRHGHNHRYRLGGRYDEGVADTASEPGMTREVVDTCARSGTTPHPVMPDLIRHP
jgi:hypothetical protein